MSLVQVGTIWIAATGNVTWMLLDAKCTSPHLIVSNVKPKTIYCIIRDVSPLTLSALMWIPMVTAGSVLMVSYHSKISVFTITHTVSNMELIRFALKLLMGGVWVQE